MVARTWTQGVALAGKVETTLVVTPMGEDNYRLVDSRIVVNRLLDDDYVLTQEVNNVAEFRCLTNLEWTQERYDHHLW